MTIKKIIKDKKMICEAECIGNHSSVNVGFRTNDGKEDETQLDVHINLRTKEGIEELSQLFASLAKELNTKTNAVLWLTVVASANHLSDFEKMEA